MAFVWSWLSKSFSHQESEHLKEKLKEALEGKDNSQLSSILAGYGHCDESQSGTGCDKEIKKKLKLFKGVVDDAFLSWKKQKCTPLMRAVHDRNLGAIKLLTAIGCDIDARELPSKSFPLYEAVGSTRAILKLLLNAGCDVNACCDAGWSPLHKAVSKKELGHVELLVDHGANINARSANGRTPLCQAVKIRSVPIVRYLISKGADVNLGSRKNQELPLLAALKDVNAEITHLLIHAGVRKDIIRKGALLDGLLLLAVSKKVFSLTPLLLQMGADPNSRNEDGKTVLMHMMTFKFEESIEYIDMLYRAGANINAVNRWGCNVFWYAANRNNISGMRWLLLHGYDMNTKHGRRVFASLVFRGRDKALELMLQNGYNTYWERSICPEAVKKYQTTKGLHAGLTAFLLDNGATVSEALWLAISQRSTKVIQLLFQYGCDIRKADMLAWKTNNGKTMDGGSFTGAYHVANETYLLGLLEIFLFFGVPEDVLERIWSCLKSYNCACNKRFWDGVHHRNFQHYVLAVAAGYSLQRSSSSSLTHKDGGQTVYQYNTASQHGDPVAASRDCTLQQTNTSSSSASSFMEDAKSWFTEPKSLKFLSRYVIRRSMRHPLVQGISLLPLPRSLKDYTLLLEQTFWDQDLIKWTQELY